MNHSAQRGRLWRRMSVFVLAALPLSLGTVGCPMAPPAGSGEQDAVTAMAQTLADRILQQDPYNQWGQFPEAEGIVPSSAHGVDQAEIRINSVVETAIAEGASTLPNDAIIVKRNIGGSGEKADSLTVMWKVNGFNPDDGDWFWAIIVPDGEIREAGAIATCLGCHGGARDNDFVFTHDFP